MAPFAWPSKKALFLLHPKVSLCLCIWHWRQRLSLGNRIKEELRAEAGRSQYFVWEVSAPVQTSRAFPGPALQHSKLKLRPEVRRPSHHLPPAHQSRKKEITAEEGFGDVVLTPAEFTGASWGEEKGFSKSQSSGSFQLLPEHMVWAPPTSCTLRAYPWSQEPDPNGLLWLVLCIFWLTSSLWECFL